MFLALVVAVGSIGYLKSPNRHLKIEVTAQSELNELDGVCYTIRIGDTVTARVVVLPTDSSSWRVVPQSSPQAAEWIDFNELVPEGVALAINGGYFSSDWKPDGLWVIDGKEIQALSNNPVLSGVVTITEEGRIDAMPLGNDTGNARFAFQAGPWLIDPGGELGIHQDDGKRFKRSIIAFTTDGETLVVSSSPASLYELASGLQRLPDILPVARVDRALNLDGGPSAGLFVDTVDGRVSMQPSGPVHHVLVCTDRAAQD